MICITWNIRGLGNEQSRNALSDLCSSHKPDWVAILEPKILSSSLPRRYLSGLKLTLYMENSRLGMRPNIWVLYRPDLAASSHIITSSDQFVAIRSRDSTLLFVHAKNTYTQRRTL